jgi:hypothetical protein
MTKFREVAVGVVLICLGAGAMIHVIKSGDWWILIPMLVLVTATQRRKCRGGSDDEPDLQDSSRMGDLEGRINDLQDIILGLDDKMNRLAKRMPSPQAETPDEERTT